MSKEIELLTCPLDRTNLIEANAGTGKTYTITTLTARMIVEKQYTVEQILVVTFTKAAAGDLKSKILDRLSQLRDGFRNGTHTDSFIGDYIKSCPIDKNTAEKRLSAAIRDFDMNSIFTIHSFCQRMLTENSFSGGIAFDTEMTGVSDEILLAPVQDFWRKYIYGLPAELASLFENETPERLMMFLIKLQNNPSAKFINTPNVDENELTELRNTLVSAFEEVKQYSKEELHAIFKKLYPEDCKTQLHAGWSPKASVKNAINSVIRQINTDDPQFREKLNGVGGHNLLTDEKIKRNNTGKNPPHEHPFFISMQKWKEAYDAYINCAKEFKITLLLRLKDYADEVLTAHKLKINSQSYGDLIMRMHSAVMQENSQMTASLRKKFSAALIDEFQDTDPHQFDIFNEVFGKYNLPFFMIGDPKQAIYSFRGADIYTYLKAAADREAATLSNNHRSDKLLVEAINTLFGKENAFLLSKIDYFDSKGLKDYPVKIGKDRLKPLTIWNTEKVNKEQIAEACAYKISELLNKNAVITTDNEERTVRPSDFAILTRSREQAKTVRNSLEKYFIPCVISGSENVFASHQAIEIAKLIQAAVTPYNEKSVRTALATDIFGYDAEMLHNLAEQDNRENIFEDFISLSELLTKRGVAPMFFQAAKMSGLYVRLASETQGERKLTNLIHLIELAQKHEAQKNASPQELLNWFVGKIEASEDSSAEYELKMDSDDNAVTITTIHKSKGLEYNIVFAPFLMFPHVSRKHGFYYYTIHDDDENLIFDFRDTESAKNDQQYENLAEDTRLTYVALTRAKALCYTSWGTISANSGNKSTAFYHLFNGATGEVCRQEIMKKTYGDDIHIDMCEMPNNAPSAYVKRQQTEITPNRSFNSEIPRPWGINSFSGLLHSTTSVRDTEQMTPSEPESADKFTIFTFPKGAKAGSCLHEIMENIHPKNPQQDHIAAVCAEKLEKYNIPAEFVPCTAEKVTEILTKELMKGITLNGLDDGEFVHEMEFHIGTKPFSSQKLSEILRLSGQDDFASACAVLGFTSAEGFLTGFADLIFTRNGKYYILDWKSNHLGYSQEDYSRERMHEEMLKSHYYLQLYFYTLALHMHLENTLPDYSYETHMGGGIYVFMRGFGDENGIYFHRPPVESIIEMKADMSEK